jgi:hypothetical protein
VLGESPALESAKETIEALKGLVESVKDVDVSKIKVAAKNLAIMTVTFLVALLAMMAAFVGFAIWIKSSGITTNEVDSVIKIAIAAIFSILAATLAAVVLGVAAVGAKVALVGLAVAGAMLLAIGAFMGAYIGFAHLIQGGNYLPMIEEANKVTVAVFKGMIPILGIAIIGAASAIAFAAMLSALNVALVAFAAFIALSATTFPIIMTGGAFALTALSIFGTIIYAIGKTVIGTIVAGLALISSEAKKLPDIGKIGTFLFTIFGAMSAIGAAAAMAIGLGIAAIVPGTGIALAAGLVVISNILDTIKEKIPPIIESLLAATSGFQDVDDLSARAEVITNILGALGSLMEPLSAVAKIAEDPGFASRMAGAVQNNVSGILLSVKTFIDSVAQTAKDFVFSMISFVKDIEAPQLEKAKMAAGLLSALMQIVSPILSAASDIASTTGQSKNTYASLTAFKETIKHSTEFITKLITEGKIKDMLSGIISVTDIIKNPNVLKGKIQILTAAFGLIGSITDTMIKLGNKESFDALTQGNINLLIAMQYIRNMAPDMKATIDALDANIPKGSLKRLDYMASFVNKTGDIANAMVVIGEKAYTGANNYSDFIRNTIIDSLYAMDELNNLLDQIQMKDIDLTVDDIAKEVSFGRKVAIEHRPINIHMNLKVKFDAELFTKSILKTTGMLIEKNNTDADQLISKISKNQAIKSLDDK